MADNAAIATDKENASTLRMEAASEAIVNATLGGRPPQAAGGSRPATFSTSPRRGARPLRSERRAAGDFDDGAVDVARLVRREPCIRVGDFLGLAETAHRNAVFHHLDDLCGHRREDRRVDDAGTDRVGADAFLAELARPCLDHADDAELR